jgi:hypothetical protein
VGSWWRAFATRIPSLKRPPGGAIVDGGHGAGKGAGIGALIGATGGTVYGLNEESKKKDATRRAYEACLARNG